MCIAFTPPAPPSCRCGVLHVGDRLLEVNHQPVDELAADQASRLLSDARPRAVLTVEFDVADTVVPSSGIFLVKVSHGTAWWESGDQGRLFDDLDKWGHFLRSFCFTDSKLLGRWTVGSLTQLNMCTAETY